MKLQITALIAVALLSGCGPALSDGKGLSVVKYTKDQQNKAADEIEGGSCPMLGNVFMPDYSVLRDQARIK